MQGRHIVLIVSKDAAHVHEQGRFVEEYVAMI